MSFVTWQSFFIIAVANIVTPGPAILNTIRRSIDVGVRRTFASISGNALGLAIDGACCAIGIGALVASSDTLFTAFTWFGVFYLAILGLKFMRPTPSPAMPGDPPTDDLRTVPSRTLFTEALLIALTNPKVFLFFLGIYPQFVDRTSALAPQVGIVLVTYVGLSICSLSSYATLANRFRAQLLNPRVHRGFQVLSGSILLAFAGRLAIGL